MEATCGESRGWSKSRRYARPPAVGPGRTWRGVRSSREVLGTVVAVLLLLVVSVAPADAAPLPYSSTPIVGGWATNGISRAVVEAGGTVYAGGAFSAAVSPNGATTARANVAAFDPATGALRPGFVANTNGTVRALASDGTTLFLAGSFTRVNGVARARLAAVNLATGAVTGFRADANSTVLNLDVYGNRLYVTGQFTSIAGAARNHVAAVDTTTGAVDAAFNPNADNLGSGIAVSPDGSRVYVGGRFTHIGGGARSFLAAVSRTTGAVVGPSFGSLSYEILDVDVSPDGSRVFGAVAGYGNQAASWSTSTGGRQWSYQVDGDVQAIRYSGGNVYFGFHEGALGDHSVRLLAADATTGALVNFRPTIDVFNGVWDIDATPTDLVIGGEFVHVAGVTRRSIANFRAGGSSNQTYLAAGSTWRYLDDGSDRGTTWRAASFDDSAWRSGRAQLGYGDGDETTTVSYGSNASAKHITTYFRTSFTVADASTISSLQLQLLRDDGAVVYVNGTQVVRSNMPTGTITSTTRASTTIAGAAETAFTSYSLSPAVLHTGTNVIAVEIHQADPTSSDISFDLGLTS